MKKYLTILLIVLFLTGCSIKNNDTLLMKTTKTTINAPVYVVKEVTPLLIEVVFIVSIIGLNVLLQDTLIKNNVKYYH